MIADVMASLVSFKLVSRARPLFAQVAVGLVLPWSGFIFDFKFISVLPHLIANRSPLTLGDISYRLCLLMKPSGA